MPHYHLRPADTSGVFERLGSVQYDPLNPVGRNHDLVLQARVLDYQLDDWQLTAYKERLVYDAWDKQACLVPVSDWPYRKLYHQSVKEYWEKRIFAAHPKAVKGALQELEKRGPLSSLDFAEQSKVDSWQGSWYGTKLIKHVLRALWDSGQIVTHHREKGRHVYDLPQRVIPAQYLNGAPVSREESLRFLILRRHQSAGLLRSNAEAALWSLPASRQERTAIIADLVAEGSLTKLEIAGQTFHALSDKLKQTDNDGEVRMAFIAPLDSLIWDRKAVKQLFDFDYAWEVYKPVTQRSWGYYVLPVFYKDRFVARFDSRLQDGCWSVFNWWWEDGTERNAEIFVALELAVKSFRYYLNAEQIKLAKGLSAEVKTAFKKGFAL